MAQPGGDSIVVANDSSKGVTDPETGEPLRTGDGLPDIAVNRHPGTPGYGSVYVVWQGTSSPSAPSDDTIYLARSTDGGSTWSAPKKVNQTPNGAAAFLPSVHVADNGAVGVTYYDLRNNDPGPSLPTDVWIVHSHDAGVTFGADAHLAGPFDFTTPRWPAGTSSATTRGSETSATRSHRSSQRPTAATPRTRPTFLHDSLAVVPFQAGRASWPAPARTTFTPRGPRRHSNPR